MAANYSLAIECTPRHCPMLLFGPNHFSMTTSMWMLLQLSCCQPELSFCVQSLYHDQHAYVGAGAVDAGQSPSQGRGEISCLGDDIRCGLQFLIHSAKSREMEWKFFMDRSVVEDISATFSQSRLREDRRALTYPAMHTRVWTERKVG